MLVSTITTRTRPRCPTKRKAQVVSLFNSPQGDPWKMGLYVYKPKSADSQTSSKHNKHQLKQQKKAGKKRRGLFGR